MPPWKSLRIFYFDPDKDGLLLDGVLPVIERLTREGAVEAWFCQRHWLHGPHLRVNLKPASLEEEPKARTALEQAALEHLERHPSTASLSSEEYLRRYGPIAALELQEEHPLPLAPNNSIHWQDLAMTAFKFGGERGMQIAIRVLAETQSVINEVIRRTRGRMSERLFLLSRLMFAYCASYEEPALAAVSFLSHAEAYLHGLPNGQKLRERFEASFASQAPALLDALREVAEEGTEDPLLVEWMSAIQRGYAEALVAARDGDLIPPRLDDYVAYEATHLPEGIRPASQGLLFEQSPLHRSMTQEGSPLANLMKTPEFKGRALMVNLMYDKFQLAGVRPLERLYLCSIVTQTIQRRYGQAGWPGAADRKPSSGGSNAPS
jgi:hypothetical protein